MNLKDHANDMLYFITFIGYDFGSADLIINAVILGLLASIGSF